MFFYWVLLQEFVKYLVIQEIFSKHANRRINFRAEMLSIPDIPIQLQKIFLSKHRIIFHQNSAILSSLQKQFNWPRNPPDNVFSCTNGHSMRCKIALKCMWWKWSHIFYCIWHDIKRETLAELQQCVWIRLSVQWSVISMFNFH